MSKSLVYIERDPDRPMMEYCLAAWQGFDWNKYDVRFFYPLAEPTERLHHLGQFHGTDCIVPTGNPYRLPLDPLVPIVGSVESTQRLLTAWNAPVPKPLNVPDELLPYAGRPIERLRLEDALLRMERDHRLQFIKPADTTKLFTGGVVATPAHVAFLFADLSPDTPVLLSPEIELVTEYRVFVNRNREIVAMRHYRGDPFVRPSKLFVRKMIDEYTLAPRSYTLDVAVTSTGKTVVVECNDMYAIGTYGMEPVAYSTMLAQRWHQLIHQLTTPSYAG